MEYLHFSIGNNTSLTFCTSTRIAIAPARLPPSRRLKLLWHSTIQPSEIATNTWHEPWNADWFRFLWSFFHGKITCCFRNWILQNKLLKARRNLWSQIMNKDDVFSIKHEVILQRSPCEVFWESRVSGTFWGLGTHHSLPWAGAPIKTNGVPTRNTFFFGLRALLKSY